MITTLIGETSNICTL